MYKVLSSLVVMTLIMTGCSKNPAPGQGAEPPSDKEDVRFDNLGKLFGEDAFKFGGDREDPEITSGIGVNTFLWQASLDTVSFIPIQSADPFGGLILTEWHSTPDLPNERVKINILILGRRLRTDGIKAKIFKQVRAHENAEWKDVTVDPQTVVDLEDTILTRARELRIQEGHTS